MVLHSRRNPAMDIVRCIALFFVVAVHFFLNTGYYEEIIQGPFLFVMTLLRSGFMVCVPLFLVLSGYLMRNRTPTVAYYKKIFKTVGIYLLASLCCLGVKLTYYGHDFYIPSLIIEITTYTAAPYAWYVEMYLGLFLLIPYLNILYNSIPSQSQKRGLLLVLILITSLPQVVNIYNFLDLRWWLMPSMTDNYHALLPEWWKNTYPLTYYFLGCYLNEFPLQLRKRKLLVLNLLVFLFLGTYNYYRSRGSVFVYGDWQHFGSLFIFIQTALFFSCFTQLNCDRLGTTVRKCLAKLSDWCFGAYLVSWIFDCFYYDVLNQLQPSMPLRFLYFPIIVPAVYISSLLLSALLNGIYDLLAKLLQKIHPFRKRLGV